MAVPLFKSLHYSNSDIATVTKLFGFGVGAGRHLRWQAGWCRASASWRACWPAPCSPPPRTSASPTWPPTAFPRAAGGGGHDFWRFAIAVSIDSFAYAFASIVLITYMSSLTSTGFAASQYALLTSLCALPGSLVAGSSGLLIQRLGFEGFFVATSLIGVPVALLCWHVMRLHRRAAA